LDGSSSRRLGTIPSREGPVARGRMLTCHTVWPIEAEKAARRQNTACPMQQRLRYPFLVVGDRTAGDEIIYPEIDLELKAARRSFHVNGTSVSGRSSDREVCSPTRRHNRQCVELLRLRPRAWKRRGPGAKIKPPARGRLLNGESWVGLPTTKEAPGWQRV
jgi:hypothetical protein